MSRPPRIEEEGIADDGDMPHSMQEALASGVQPAELGVAQRERMRRRVYSRPTSSRPKALARCARAKEGGCRSARSWKSGSCIAMTARVCIRASCACVRAA